MKLFAIHAPHASPEAARAAKTGFAPVALIFGPLWLLVRGLWLALAGYVALAALAGVALGEGWLRPGAAVLLVLLGNLYLAFEGRALAIAARGRSGRPLVDLVFAQSALEAEKIHLERALALGAVPLRAAPPPGAADVIGLFPEPGR